MNHKPKENLIPVVFSFDNNYILQGGVCIESLLRHAHQETRYHVHILYGESFRVDAVKQLKQLETVFPGHKIDLISVGDSFKNAFEVRNVTIATYYRLLIPELIREYDKVIYTDVDLVFNTDLSSMYAQDMEGYYMGGVCVRADKDNCRKIGVDPEGYINAGSLLMNCRLLREDGVCDRFREMAKKQFKFQDQDIINIICSGRIQYLDPVFNMTHHHFITELNKGDSPVSRQVVIHYNGKKPWKYPCLRHDQWWEEFRKSIFFDETLYLAWQKRIQDGKQFDRKGVLKLVLDQFGVLNIIHKIKYGS